jgi:Spy/CpxP family protein refolding chaperone
MKRLLYTDKNRPKYMKRMKAFALAAALALGANLASTTVRAQQDRPNRGNPEEFRQRMMDSIREEMDVKSDDEWKIISERISKVMDARRDIGFGGFGFGRRGGPGGDQAAGGGGGGGRRGFGQPSPEGEALQKAIESKASADEIKAKLAKYRDARKEKQEKLHKAQEDLKAVLSQKQEAVAVIRGLID